MKKLLQKILFVVLAVSQLGNTAAQNRWQPVISPEVHSDKTVTFRLWMPDAKEVKVSVQFERDQKKMVKGDSGIWSVTLGPVKPDIYPYSFFVDGVQIMDPSNRLYFPNERFKSSLVDIPGDEPLIHSIQNVPHGTVSYNYYQSKTTNTTRQLVVYTPPDYENNPVKKYPVLYLIHGMTDTEETWFKAGHANLILDNLIAREKAEPMIIVMPYANIFADLYADSIVSRETILRTDLFTNELLNEVIPFAEKNYRIIADGKNRAIAGFSLGGRQTLAAGLANPDKFSWVCAYAPAIWKNELGENFNEIYASSEELNQLKLFSVSCGTEDFLYNSSLDLIKVLKEKNITHKTFFPDGGHTWMNCKLFLTETAQQLFKNN